MNTLIATCNRFIWFFVWSYKC